MRKKIQRKDLKNKRNKFMHDFQQFEIIGSFGDSIYTGKISVYET